MRTEFHMFSAAEFEQGKRPYYPLNPEEADSNIDSWTLQKLRNDARRVYCNFGPLKQAVHTLSFYSVQDGLTPCYRGTNTAWGKKATNWWMQIFSQTGNILGPTRNWWESWQLVSRMIDIYGEAFILKIVDKDTQFPRYQMIPPSKVGNSRNGLLDNDVISKGPYKGLRMVYGVCLSKFGQPVAYNVLGPDAKGSDDKIYPASQMLHIGEWLFVDQTRPVSALAAGILDIRDIISVVQNEKRALEIASSISVLEQTPTGAVDLNDPLNYLRVNATNVDPDNQQQDQENAPQSPGYDTQFPGPLRATVMKDNGEYKLLKAQTGSSIECFQFQRPSTEVGAFLDRLGAQAISGIWPYQLLGAPTTTGPATRSLWIKANNLTKSRQQKILPAVKTLILFSFAQAIEAGVLEYDESWMDWDINLPKKPSVDASRSSADDINDVKYGIKAWSDVWGEMGTDAQTQTLRKAMDVIEFMKAKKIAQDLYEAETGETIVIPDDYLFNIFPNGSPTPQDATVSGTPTINTVPPNEPDADDLDAAEADTGAADDAEPTGEDEDAIEGPAVTAGVV
jgi:hypothetical protein